jgi:hypothetical protein
MKPEIKIGDTYFIFSENNRVYEKSNGNIIYRKHFVETKIHGETSRSWIIGPWYSKVPKSNPWGILFTAEMVDDAVWAKENKWKISNAVQRLNDIRLLRNVAEIIGYKETAK